MDGCMIKGRKAQAEVWNVILIFEVVLSVLIAAVLVYSAAHSAMVSELNKVYTEKDIALVIDAVSASNGKIIAKYPLSSAFNVEFKKKEQMEGSTSGNKIKITRDLTSGNLFSIQYIVFTKNRGEDITIRRMQDEQ